jgi:hypothetical protein
MTQGTGTATADPARTTKCLRCGRTLRSASSVAAQVGRHCKAKIAQAAKTSTAKPAQVEKARELIELGAIAPLRRRNSGTRVFRVVSSRGDATYLCTAGQCNCAAGLKGRYGCYHELAVQLVLAA